MTARLCSTCGAPLTTPFCGSCGTPAAATPGPGTHLEVDATAVRRAPLVPASVSFPPSLTLPPAPFEPTVPIPPLYAPPSMPAASRATRDRRPMWMTLGALGAVAAGALTAVAVLSEGSTHAGSNLTDNVTSVALPTALLTSAGAVVSTQDPGTRSPAIPTWANTNVGRLIRAQVVLGAGGPAVFASPGHNTCAVVGADVTCVATPLWHKDNPALLPPVASGCSASPDGRWTVFSVGPSDPATVQGCTSRPAALTLESGTASHNTVIGMGATGALCYIDARKHAPTSQTGVACWNPASNHGFMITNQDMRIW